MVNTTAVVTRQQRPAAMLHAHHIPARPLLMGVLNITPDSFSDGGLLYRDGAVQIAAVLQRAQEQVDAGADILDVGGESTRPGAEAVSDEMEIARVVPVIAALAERFAVQISVDTSSPRVMREAAQAGASIINDVRALTRPGAVAAAVDSGLRVCLMHMRGEPATMQVDPGYTDVVAEVKAFLSERVAACLAAGIAREHLMVDPGFGFGKSLQHNLQLFRALPELVAQGLPVVVGVSRKSMIGNILQRPVDERLQGSVSLALLAAQSGVSVLRVHDVGATMDALRILEAVRGND